MGSRGTPIYAIDGGTVTRSGYQSNGSLILDITGSNGMFFYGHFDSILFSVGQRVKAGQVIGYMGDTGSSGGGAPAPGVASQRLVRWRRRCRAAGPPTLRLTPQWPRVGQTAGVADRAQQCGVVVFVE